MANINLLPWREELRAEKKKEFLTILVFAALFAGIIMIGVHTVYQNRINHQNERNQRLSSEIVRLDKQIKEIQELERQKEELINRMEIIQNLQQSRPQIVRLFDELVRIVPDGVFLETLERKQNNLLMSGKTDSNPRVSTFMRNIENSQWVELPTLKNIVSDAQNKNALSDFRLSARIVKLKGKKEEQ